MQQGASKSGNLKIVLDRQSTLNYKVPRDYKEQEENVQNIGRKNG
jgi:hypothetical protein